MSDEYYALGIDFGTCFSFPASVIGEKPIPLLLNLGAGIPTIFYYKETEKKVEVLTGDAANDYIRYNPDYPQNNFVPHIKLDLVQNKTKARKVGNQMFSCEDICAHILKSIVKQAEKVAEVKSGKEGKFQRAVITIPFINEENANVEAKIKEILRAAATTNKNGPNLSDVDFIYEPVAAAYYYAEYVAKRPSWLKEKDYVLVYDLGGGTCDLALVQKNPQESKYPYSVIYQGRPDEEIGGELFDKKIAEYLIEKNKSQVSSLSEHNEVIFRMGVKKAKEQLSSPDSEEAKVFYDTEHEPLTLTKVELETIIDADVTTTVEDAYALVKKAAAHGHPLLDKEDGTLTENVDVVMVGGSSNIPLIQQKLQKKLFGDGSSREVKLVDPHYAIGYGAAMFANSLSNGENPIEQRIHFSYGIRTVEYTGWILPRRKIVLRNEIIKGSTLPTKEDNWNTVYIDSFSGDDDAKPVVALECYANSSEKDKLPFKKAVDKDGMSIEPALTLTFDLSGITVSNELQLRYRIWLDEGNTLQADGMIIDSKNYRKIPVRRDLVRPGYKLLDNSDDY